MHSRYLCPLSDDQRAHATRHREELRAADKESYESAKQVRRPIIKSVSVCEIPDSDRATTAMFRSSARAPAALRRRRGLVGAGGAVPTGYCARHSYALLLMSRTLCLGQTQRSPIGIGNGAVTTLLLAVMDGEQ
jgi:hypothetical protein